jgi:hypothetical protein
MRTVDYEVYLITAPGYWYVGSTTRGAQRRFKEHLSGANSHAPRLTAKVRSLGQNAFQQIIVEAGYGDPIEAERRWYDFYITHDARHTLNSRPPGGWPDNLGRVRPERERAKISASMKGRQQTAEHKANVRAALVGKTTGRPKGYRHTAASKAKMSAAMQSLSVECECGMRSRPGPLGQHIRATGHQRKI